MADSPTGTWTHWVVIDMAADVQQLPQDASGNLPGAALEGLNSWRKARYGGPCPPPGSPHHYRFTVYALDAPTGLTEAVSAGKVEAAMDGHVLAQARLTGLFGR